MLETARHIIKMTEYLPDDPALKEFFLKFGESGVKIGTEIHPLCRGKELQPAR
jgi:hypothetical protein